MVTFVFVFGFNISHNKYACWHLYATDIVVYHRDDANINTQAPNEISKIEYVRTSTRTRSRVCVCSNACIKS